MKNHLRILVALILCIFIYQNNVEGQIFKNALNKVKGAVNNTANKVVDGKVDGVLSGAAKPAAPEVKNSISDVRALTGLTKEKAMAKLKSMGFVEGQDLTGMGGTCYFSKAKGYYLNVDFGTRGDATYSRQITKTIITKKPNLATLKTNYLNLRKQCLDLKTQYGSGKITGLTGSRIGHKIKKAEDFPEAFNSFISSKEAGIASETYSENDYNYVLSFTYTQAIPAAKVEAANMIMISISDLTIEN